MIPLHEARALSLAVEEQRKQLETLTRRVEKLERVDILPAPLLDVLRSFGGGVAGLAQKSGIAEDTLYLYARGGKSPTRFSPRIARAVSSAFEGRRVFGSKVTIDRQRVAWERARADYLEKQDG